MEDSEGSGFPDGREEPGLEAELWASAALGEETGAFSSTFKDLV
jgi:hypothetical protein